MSEKKDFVIYTYSEVKTAGGQVVKFSCEPDDVEKIKKFIGSLVKGIEIPQAKEISGVGHGGYGRYSRFEVKQHKYAGRGYPGCGGYIEVLQIFNPIEGKCGNIFYSYHQQEYSTFAYFIEWETIEDALNAFQKHWEGLDSEKYSKLPGFKRRVECGNLEPWFYAVGDQEIIGDYAFPEDLQDDPVYTIGRKFVVYVDGYKDQKMPVVKTCIGCKTIVDDYKTFHRVIYWKDGTIHEDNKYKYGKQPRPLEEADEEDLWAYEIRKKLPSIKDGGQMVIHFADGMTFRGSFTKREKPTPKGNYFVSVILKGVCSVDTLPIEGWVDFVPTEENPLLSEHVMKMFSKHGLVVNSITIKKKKKTEGKEPNLFFFIETQNGDE